jgi:hypothetical protein
MRLAQQIIPALRGQVQLGAEELQRFEEGQGT